MARPLLVVFFLSLSLRRAAVSVFFSARAHFLSNDTKIGSLKSLVAWGNLRERMIGGENKLLRLPRAVCIQSSFTSLSHTLRRVLTVYSLSPHLSSSRAHRSSRTRSKKPRYFPSCFPAATGSTRREIPREQRKQKRRRRNSGGHSRLP